MKCTSIGVLRNEGLRVSEHPDPQGWSPLLAGQREWVCSSATMVHRRLPALSSSLQSPGVTPSLIGMQEIDLTVLFLKLSLVPEQFNPLSAVPAHPGCGYTLVSLSLGPSSATNQTCSNSTRRGLGAWQNLLGFGSPVFNWVASLIYILLSVS